MLSGIRHLALLIVLLIVIAIFGTKKLRGLGGDLGGVQQLQKSHARR